MSYQRRVLTTGQGQYGNSKVRQGILCMELYPIPPPLTKQACKGTELFEPYSYRKTTVPWLCNHSHYPSFSPLPLSFVDEGCFFLSIFLERVAHCLRCDNSSSASSRWQPSGMDIQKGSLSSIPSDIWPDSTGWNRQWENIFLLNLAMFECTLLIRVWNSFQVFSFFNFVFLNLCPICKEITGIVELH